MVTNQTHHDGTEERADARRAAALDREERRRGSTQVSGTTTGFSCGGRDLEPLDRAEHRDRRRDDAVAVEQRRADDDEHRRPRPMRSSSALLRSVVGHERQQREDAALAVVVGAHDERQVLDGDDHRQRPEDQRQDAEHVLGVGATPCSPRSGTRAACRAGSSRCRRRRCRGRTPLALSRPWASWWPRGLRSRAQRTRRRRIPRLLFPASAGA